MPPDQHSLAQTTPISNIFSCFQGCLSNWSTAVYGTIHIWEANKLQNNITKLICFSSTSSIHYSYSINTVNILFYIQLLTFPSKISLRYCSLFLTKKFKCSSFSSFTSLKNKTAKQWQYVYLIDWVIPTNYVTIWATNISSFQGCKAADRKIYPYIHCSASSRLSQRFQGTSFFYPYLKSLNTLFLHAF